MVQSVTYYTSQSRKSVVVIASAETLYYGTYFGKRRYIMYYYIGRCFQIDFYECAHTQCFCKRSVGAYINAYAVCVIHRGRKQMFSQPVFGSPTRRLLWHCTAAIIYLYMQALHFCDKSRTAEWQLYENRYYIGTWYVPHLRYNTLFTWVL